MKITKPIRLIFLDIDGVLNSVKTFTVTGYYPHANNVANSEGKYISHPESVDNFSVGLINKLCKSTDSFVVISSSWRVGYTFSQIKQIMIEMGIDEDVILGMTDDNGYNRGMEIQRFIKYISSDIPSLLGLITPGTLTLPVKVDSYCVVDDYLTNNGIKQLHSRNFVEINQLDGLGLKDIIRMGRIITKDSQFDECSL